MNWADNLLHFYFHLQPPALPKKIQWLHPQQDEKVMEVVERFLHKFYNDNNKRTLILGINPGRFGAGVTGVNFTAPKQLTEILKIPHHFKMQSELSAEFIYTMIEAYGGARKFYQHYFIGSVCPLGFTREGKNINYYDDRNLAKIVEPFVVACINDQVSFNVDCNTCYCIGGEKNFKYLQKLNEQHKWFRQIIPLPHPRFIMQYRRKKMDTYVQMYLEELSK
ncbi:MAG: uracil-DNA glycosylase family protein [Candidatus Dadabacteria bacterium]